MRITRLLLTDFRGFKCYEVWFKERFTLLVGNNGRGKTSILEGLAVSLGLWNAAMPQGARRVINEEDIRLTEHELEGRTSFVPAESSKVSAWGDFCGFEKMLWSRSRAKQRSSGLTPDSAAKGVDKLLAQASSDSHLTFPVLAYYGAGRAWLSTRERQERQKELEKGDTGKKTRFSAYHYCLDGKVREAAINLWFRDEKLADNERSGFHAIKAAVIRSLPGCHELSYDVDRKELSFHFPAIDKVARNQMEDGQFAEAPYRSGGKVPFSCLSDGQRMLVSLVADLAIKSITLNPHLGDHCLHSPGVVLIDELDLHLHPAWQRQVPALLKESFPEIQFVCSSHSPLILGELRREEILLLPELQNALPTRLGYDDKDHPQASFGLDVNWILERIMLGAISRNPEARKEIDAILDLLDNQQLTEAQATLDALRHRLGGEDAEISRVQARLKTQELLQNADD